MVKKHVFEFGPLQSSTQTGTQTGEDPRTVDALLRVNDGLHEDLRAYKDEITAYFHEKKWDKYKKHSNEYELVFTSSKDAPSVASYAASSRSFYKMWEVLHDFREELRIDRPEAMRVAFMAEGPGGFLEAVYVYRSDCGPTLSSQDALFGITLVGRERSIPCWKLPKHIARSHRVKLCTGVDGTGNLYELKNVDDFIAQVGEASCDLVTGDGGFDFSGDFNQQEVLSHRLVAAEILTAIQVQAPGGCFLLKMFDISQPTSMRFLQILRSVYERVFVFKPLTSRPANSEKYVLCARFRPRSQPVQIVHALRASVRTGSMRPIDDYLDALPIDLILDVVRFNTLFVHRQILQIHKTILFIQLCEFADVAAADGFLASEKREFADGFLASEKRKQLAKSIRWCHKYRIKLSLDALRKYCPK